MTVYIAMTHGPRIPRARRLYDVSDYIIGVYSTPELAAEEARKFTARADGRDYLPAFVQSYTVDADRDVIPPA